MYILNIKYKKYTVYIICLYIHTFMQGTQWGFSTYFAIHIMLITFQNLI